MRSFCLRQLATASELLRKVVALCRLLLQLLLVPISSRGASVANSNDFTFRFKFTRSPRDTIKCEGNEWAFQDPTDGHRLRLKSVEKDNSIKESKHWLLKADGWPTHEAAEAAGKRYSDALIATLVRLRIGIDLGRRGPQSAYTQDGLAWLKENFRFDRPLNDTFGLSVFESNPPPQFIATKMRLTREVNEQQFAEVFEASLRIRKEITEQEYVSIELFGASFFQETEDTRFLLLVIAIETLVDPPSRSAEAIRHVENMMALTKSAESLSRAEKSSLLGSMKWLLQESINQTGRKLVSDRLGERRYLDMSAPAFFSHCYNLRSHLTHGKMTMEEYRELGTTVATLEVFVSDLLSNHLLSVGPNP